MGSALEGDFQHYLDDTSVGKTAGAHPLTDLLRRLDVNVDKESVRKEFLEHTRATEGVWVPDATVHMIDVVVKKFGWAGTLLLPDRARHVGDPVTPPMAYVYDDDDGGGGKLRWVMRQPDGVVAPAADLWHVEPVEVDPALRERALRYVDDHEQLIGADYEWAMAAAADRQKFAGEVEPAIRRWVDLRLKLNASAGEPTLRLLMQILIEYHLLEERIKPALVNLKAGAAGEVPGLLLEVPVRDQPVLVLGSEDWPADMGKIDEIRAVLAGWRRTGRWWRRGPGAVALVCAQRVAIVTFC